MSLKKAGAGAMGTIGSSEADGLRIGASEHASMQSTGTSTGWVPAHAAESGATRGSLVPGWILIKS